MEGKRILILCIWGAVIVIVLFSLEGNLFPKFSKYSEDVRTIQLVGENIRVSVAHTPEAREQGLGGRNKLNPHEGMLFVFDTTAKHQFWMKDMLFPIDILWLSDTGKVVDIREIVSPNTYPAIFSPRQPARYTLELPAGFVGDNNVTIGDVVRL